MINQLGNFPSNISNDIEHNMILKSDSYKMSHYLMLPDNIRKMRSYIEARGGMFPNTIFFGLQMCLRKYFTKSITNQDILEAEYFAKVSGLPFNKQGWKRIVNIHGGYIPLEINAVKEGTNVPILNALVTIDSTDPELVWLTTYYEPMLLRACWYSTTVCTLSWTIKQLIKEYMQLTCDTLDGLNYKLHDFGSRGVSSGESAGIGGAAHLVNFWGSDTIEGAVTAMYYYNCDVPLRSIPASEHSVTTIWGKAHEIDSYRNMLNQFATPGSKISIVADSYDLFGMISTMIGGDLKQQIIDSEATVIIRPDSGIPHEIVLNTIEALMYTFGYHINTKGYKVLPEYIRCIQGDGINYDSIKMILQVLTAAKISTDNIFFGMGGKLLQGVMRDDQNWANKVCQGLVNDTWVDVYKDPITDTGKKSKRGRQMLYEHRTDGRFKTESVHQDIIDADYQEYWKPALDPVYKNGHLLRTQTFDNIRTIAKF